MFLPAFGDLKRELVTVIPFLRPYSDRISIYFEVLGSGALEIASDVVQLSLLWSLHLSSKWLVDVSTHFIASVHVNQGSDLQRSGFFLDGLNNIWVQMIFMKDLEVHIRKAIQDYACVSNLSLLFSSCLSKFCDETLCVLDCGSTARVVWQQCWMNKFLPLALCSGQCDWCKVGIYLWYCLEGDNSWASRNSAAPDWWMSECISRSRIVVHSRIITKWSNGTDMSSPG